MASRQYAPGTGHFPAPNSATIKLTHYPQLIIILGGPGRALPHLLLYLVKSARPSGQSLDLSVLVVLREKRPQVVDFFLVLDPGEYHLGAGNLRLGILDVVLELGLVPGDAGILVGVRIAARVSLKRCKSIVRAAGTSMARVELDQEPERPARDEGELSTTCKNSRLRQARDKAWDRACQTTSYWRARLDWHGELECAQKWGLADSGSFPPAADENRFWLVDTWREAVVKQLLTPAPKVAAVAWKRAKFSGRDFSYLPVKPERVERVIADDVAFLDAHPTRTRKGR